MLIVFEDNDKTPSSVLLRSSYYGDHIYFTHGSTRLGVFIESHIHKEDLLVFVDVAPNNGYTVLTYDRLVRKFKGYIDSGKLVLLPIICIEYIILSMLVNYKYIDADKSVYLQNLIVKFDYNNEKLQEKIKCKDSLEKLLKEVLVKEAQKVKSKCLMNKFKYDSELVRDKDSIFGIFYDRDCKCLSKFCKLGCSDSLQLKAERLYTSLPVCYVLDNEHRRYLQDLGLETEDCDIRSIFSNLQCFYDKVCDELKVSRLKIRYKQGLSTGNFV